MEDLDKEVQEALEVLKKGGTILYPTDTVWGIGCDATNARAVEKVYALKQRNEQKALICLVPDVKMLEKFISEIPEAAYDILEHADTPTTIIYDKPIGVAENLVGEDDTLALRLTKDPFCQQLLRKMRRPLVSTSANISGEKTPESFSQISPEILKGVDYVVNLHRTRKTTKPSAIIKISNNGIVKVIRK